LEDRLAEHESSLAVLVDFENMARPGAKGRDDFDIHLVLNRLAEKGRVLVKRAYADWSRYRDARHELQNAGLGLIEMPSAREGAKNRADIQMAVDAMELAYSREHVDNFVIVSGDSDFTPLVGKLRELNKRVIGVGNRESASELLIANCDEFIFYDSLAAKAGGTSPRRTGGAEVNPVQLLQETLTALQREGVEWPLASVAKDSMRRKYPAFDESDHGYSTFSKFLEDASAKGMIRLETDPRSGTYRVELAEGREAALPPVPVATAAASSDEGEGRRRRRRRRGEPAPAEAAGEAEAAEETEAAEAAEAGAAPTEVFEVVVTPTPDPDLGALPPLSEPISYEDMIMLGPEVGEDVPELVEVTDVGSDEPPSRSARRRRRRAAVAEPEPTVADLEPLGTDALEVPEEPAAEAPAVPAEEAVAAEGDALELGSRRRRRRIATPVLPEEAAEAPSTEALETPEEVAPPEEPAAEDAQPVAEDQEPATGRRRVRRRAAAAPEPAAEAEPAAEEAPKPRRRSRKAAEPAPEEGAAAEEAPKPRRRSRKAAEPAAEEPAAS